MPLFREETVVAALVGSRGSIIVQPLAVRLFNYLSFNEESSLSDLKSYNHCKNLWGETKYLGNSCCWPPAWFEVLRSV